MSWFLLFCLHILLFIGAVTSDYYGSESYTQCSGSDCGSWDTVNNKNNLLSYLSSINYNPYDVPFAVYKGYDSITMLTVLYRVSSFDQKATKFSIFVDILVSWRDAFNFNTSKIMSSSTPLDLSSPNTTIVFDTFSPRKVWYPNIFLPSFRKAERSDETGAAENSIITVDFSDGSDAVTPIISFRRRAIGDVSCKMDFRKFPLDSQKCSIPIVLLDFDKTIKIVPKFLGPSGAIALNSMDATVSFNGNYGGYSVPVFNKKSLTLSSVKSPGVEIIVSMKRKSGTYVIKHFIPLSLITACGLLSLWVSIDAAPARVGLSITSILSLVAISFPFSGDIPDAPYLTWTNIFNIICLFFAFITVLVFTIVHTIKLKFASVHVPCTKSTLWTVVDKSLCYLFTVGFFIVIIVFFPVISTA